ncbi:hypothetical protein ACE38V_02405 [Cytobacillus sp. Hz8]|uniref:hypothetical protein n=1 Tax=Cytobacillus sp. Hz8 TaxID=3347168 RepID=UPI0035DF7302
MLIVLPVVQDEVLGDQVEALERVLVVRSEAQDVLPADLAEVQDEAPDALVEVLGEVPAVLPDPQDAPEVQDEALDALVEVLGEVPAVLPDPQDAPEVQDKTLDALVEVLGEVPAVLLEGLEEVQDATQDIAVSAEEEDLALGNTKPMISIKPEKDSGVTEICGSITYQTRKTRKDSKC